MKKQLYFLKNEQGFTLPIVLFLSTLILLYITTNLIMYQHDVKITANLMEQVKAQTLFEIGYNMYKSEQLPHYNREQIVYRLPDGMVTIETSESIGYIHLQFTIQTNNNNQYLVTKSLEVEKNEDNSS